MRGLIHEVCQRLIEQSQVYHLRLKEYKKLKEQLGFSYFGLNKDATEKELEAAYRTLAKKMHPDKNGGTEDAKKKFQTMKERYESLKKRVRRRAQGLDSGDETDSSDSDRRGSKNAGDASPSRCAGQILDGEAPPEDAERRANQKHRKEAYDEDEDDEADRKRKKDKKAERRSSSINYDPTDRDSMCKCMGEMIIQLKNIRPQQEQLAKQLYEVSSEIVNKSHTA